MEVLKLNEFLLESKNEHSFGCMMLFVKLEGIDKFHDKIDKKDLHEKGIEKDTHITIKYGFKKEVSDHEILNICRKEKFNNIKFNKISLFENEEFDVLKFDVQSEILIKLNKKISKFPNEDKYPDYNAHSTICFLKKGKGEKYLKIFEKINLKAVPDKLVYSNIDNTKLILDL